MIVHPPQRPNDVIGSLIIQLKNSLELVTYSTPFTVVEGGQENDEDDDVVSEPAESINNLTASSVRTPCSESAFSVQSSTVIGEEVETEQVKGKLYLDKRESSPCNALLFCQKQVNSLKKLRCGRDEDCITY